MATEHPSSAPLTNLMRTWHKDEIVEELHRHRAEVHDRFKGDLDRICDYYASFPVDADVQYAELEPVTPKKSPGQRNNL